MLNAVVTDIIGEGSVQGIRVKDTKTGESREISVAGLFVAIGQMPDNKAFEPLVEPVSYTHLDVYKRQG